MDEINKTIQKALEFAQAVQKSCNEQRYRLEHHLSQELTEISQKKKKNVIKEEETVSTDAGIIECVEVIEEKLEDLELEEIKLADKLLEKARRIRQKYKVPSLSTDTVNSSNFAVHSAMKQSASVTYNTNLKDIVDTVGTCKVRQSKSAPEMNQTHSTSPTKKGSKIPQSIKPPKVSKSNLGFESRIRTSSKSPAYSKNGNDMQLPITVSSKDIHMHKRLCMYGSRPVLPKENNCSVSEKNLSVKCKKVSTICSANKKPSGVNKKLKKSNLKSLCLPKAAECSQEEEQDFQKTTEDHNITNVCEKKNMKISFSSRLWYPFMNLKNVRYLTLHMTYGSRDELKHICVLFHKIQETLFWLDLLSLIGNEITRQLQNVDIASQKFALILSHIQSLFHERLQRIPLVVQP